VVSSRLALGSAGSVGVGFALLALGVPERDPDRILRASR
jgi:hypothetical protein